MEYAKEDSRNLRAAGLTSAGIASLCLVVIGGQRTMLLEAICLPNHAPGQGDQSSGKED